MGGTCSTHSIYKKYINILEEKREAIAWGMQILENNRHIKMNLKEIECGSADWIQLAQCRNQWRNLIDMIMNLPVP
jgi:hypothetical protein